MPRQKKMQDILKYRQRIRSFRWVMGGCLILIVGAFLYWFGIPDMLMSKTLEAPTVHQTTVPEHLQRAHDCIINFHVKTSTLSEYPAELAASRATENTKGIYDLESPQAWLTLKDGPKFHVHSVHGTASQDQKYIHLWQDVQCSFNQDNRLFLQNLNIDLETKKAFTDEPVHGIANKSIFKGQGLVLDQTSETLFIKGPAEIVFVKEDRKSIGNE